jgi:hypothetical protein
MFSDENLVSRSELSMVIAICGVLSFLAFTSVGHLAWSIPAMTLFLATGAGFLYALFAGPRATTLLS